jgi:hypothetical protein
MIFDTKEDDPSEKITPRKIDTPLNASDPEPGIKGYITIPVKAMMNKRTIF